VRIAVALVAVLVVAWLGVMLRDARLLSSAVEASGRLQAPGDAERAAADFRAARLLNPDTAPDVGLALLLQTEGRREQATALLEDVLEREPENLTAWGLLYNVARTEDPATARRAFEARRRLDPIRARPR
jgi:tetratricopeptide (TPR) repeat protein